MSQEDVDLSDQCIMPILIAEVTFSEMFVDLDVEPSKWNDGRITSLN